MSPGAKPSPSKSHWHRLPNWDIIFKFGTLETLSSLLPLPLERQNIPDGFIIPCYPQNIQFLPPIVPDSECTHPTATSDIVVICLLVPPTLCSTPPPYYTPRPPIRHPRHIKYPTCSPKIPYLSTKRALAPWHTPWFTLFFGWWGLSHIHWSCMVGLVLVWRLEGSSYRWSTWQLSLMSQSG